MHCCKLWSLWWGLSNCLDRCQQGKINLPILGNLRWICASIHWCSGPSFHLNGRQCQTSQSQSDQSVSQSWNYCQDERACKASQPYPHRACLVHASDSDICPLKPITMSGSNQRKWPPHTILKRSLYIWLTFNIIPLLSWKHRDLKSHPYPDPAIATLQW